MSELSFDRVSVRFGPHHAGLIAVDDVSLCVPTGQTVGLVGESGSGKSTLARAAVGLVPLASGQIRLDGVPIAGSDRARRGNPGRPVQMVFQDPYASLDPRMSVGRTVAEALPGRAGRARRSSQVRELLELVGLDPAVRDERPGALSGGQRHRVAIARALAAQPRVLIADEISASLDVSIQSTVLNLIRGLQRELGLTLLFISHNLAVINYVADVVGVMYLGQLVEHGQAEQVLRRPEHPYTQELLAAAPDPNRRIRDDPTLQSLYSQADDDRYSVRSASQCQYRDRCPVGPLHRPERTICSTQTPTANGHRNSARCHFARSSS